MQEIRNMHSKNNSLEGIKEKYKKAVIDNYSQRLTELRNKQKSNSINMYDIEQARNFFDSDQYVNAFDNSLGSNDRWGIVSKKNFFGLEAVFFPRDNKEIRKDNRLYLKLMSGRFQMQKFPNYLFPSSINISDLINRNENEQFTEIEEFYTMNNRQVFEKYGVNADSFKIDGKPSDEIHLLANCVILDSLLQGRYSEMKDVFCWTPTGYSISIKLEDGTEITANTSANSYDMLSKKGITIKKDGKEATVDFDAISIGDNPNKLTNINDLEVENIVYTGEAELVTQLQQAMQEQFISQKKRNDNKKTVDSPNELEEETGAEKIIEFMKQNNLGPHDLALALSMTLARTTDKNNAEQHVVNEANNGKENSETAKSEH